MEGRYWIVRIVRPGESKYATTENGDFHACGKGRPYEPYKFETRLQAIAAYDRWAMKHPVESAQWSGAIEEEE